MYTRYLFCVILLLGGLTQADEVQPKTARDWLKQANNLYGRRDFAAAVKAYSKAIDLSPRLAEAWDRRGSAHFMVGKFKESVADFDHYLTLEPKEANGHWRRGISLYYAGKYDEGKKQFEGYENVDTNDVENAVWHFICAAKKDGIEKARGKILKIGRDGRVPMMQVYELFKGKLKPEDVLKSAMNGALPPEQRKKALFYAHLYLGIYFDITGEKKKAIDHLRQASEKYRIDHYMGEVARVHFELLNKK